MLDDLSRNQFTSHRIIETPKHMEHHQWKIVFVIIFMIKKKKLFVKSIKGYVSYKFLNIFNPYIILLILR